MTTTKTTKTNQGGSTTSSATNPQSQKNTDPTAGTTDTQKQPEISPDDVRRQVRAVGDEMRELAKQVKGLAGGTLQSARSSLGDRIDTGKDRAADLEDQLVDYVRAQPVKSLLWAAGAGALLTMFMRK